MQVDMTTVVFGVGRGRETWKALKDGRAGMPLFFLYSWQQNTNNSLKTLTVKYLLNACLARFLSILSSVDWFLSSANKTYPVLENHSAAICTIHASPFFVIEEMISILSASRKRKKKKRNWKKFTRLAFRIVDWGIGNVFLKDWADNHKA